VKVSRAARESNKRFVTAGQIQIFMEDSRCFHRVSHLPEYHYGDLVAQVSPARVLELLTKHCLMKHADSGGAP